MKTHRIFLTTVGLLASASLTFAQNANQAAVDTLTKDVAKAVFGSLQLLPNNLKAAQIYDQLTNCGEGCDATVIIRTVGGYDAVGVKMEELGRLKNTARFQAMSPEDANAGIRQELAQFYAKYKADKNYGKPLSPAVQAQLLAKIDEMLPPAIAPEPSPAAINTSAASETATGDETSITPEALQLSKLERRATEAEEKQLLMMIIGALVGLVVGAGGVYIFAYRALKNEVDRLVDDNNRLSRQNDGLRTKPTNEPRQPQGQGDFRQKANAYDAILAELGTENPLIAIRQLKQQTDNATLKSVPVMRSGEPVIEPDTLAKPAPPVHIQAQATPIQTAAPLPTPARSEVFYFPPPDPNGQFDLPQKSSSLSPESAYRFSISAANPSVASFRFEAEPGRVARFLTYRNYMIEPACESENSYTPTHTRITMRRDGEAVLENSVWRVKTKALIRYE
ncbi:hypothetical protein [Spirosoma flavum]|uniref:Uncharacterized protein n=1 Tax=Spirosoma flavum TaxID=2048557 RepID=A0ABW6AHG4_9BACT